MAFLRKRKCDGRLKGRKLSKRCSIYMEYAMLAALVGIVGATAIVVYGKELKSFFQTLGQKAHDTTKAINSGKK